eukprot:3998204-Amphidinium_carterae.1
MVFARAGVLAARQGLRLSVNVTPMASSIYPVDGPTQSLNQCRCSGRLMGSVRGSGGINARFKLQTYNGGSGMSGLKELGWSL